MEPGVQSHGYKISALIWGAAVKNQKTVVSPWQGQNRFEAVEEAQEDFNEMAQQEGEVMPSGKEG